MCVNKEKEGKKTTNHNHFKLGDFSVQAFLCIYALPAPSDVSPERGSAGKQPH